MKHLATKKAALKISGRRSTTFQKFGKDKNVEENEGIWKYVSYNVTYCHDLKPPAWPFSKGQNSERQMKWTKRKMINYWL